jgi:hypothetical protein
MLRDETSAMFGTLLRLLPTGGGRFGTERTLESLNRHVGKHGKHSPFFQEARVTAPKKATSPELLKEQVDGCVERIKQYRETIAARGLTVDASEEPGWKPNPFIKIETEQRRLLLALLRATPADSGGKSPEERLADLLGAEEDDAEDDAARIRGQTLPRAPAWAAAGRSRLRALIAQP